MKFLKYIPHVLGAVALIAAGIFLHYYLPSTAVVQITGTDVKRKDVETGQYVGPRTPGTKKGVVIETRDVRYINTVSADGKVHVYRNEDTGWGWPPYFKFDSADVTAEAQAKVASGKRPWVLMTHYGWRIQLFSMFPNAIGFREVDKDYTHIPWFNIVFLTVLFGSIFLLLRWFWRFIQRLRLDERWDVGTKPFANIVAWIKAEAATWRKKPAKRPGAE